VTEPNNAMLAEMIVVVDVTITWSSAFVL